MTLSPKTPFLRGMARHGLHGSLNNSPQAQVDDMSCCCKLYLNHRELLKFLLTQCQTMVFEGYVVELGTCTFVSGFVCETEQRDEWCIDALEFGLCILSLECPLVSLKFLYHLLICIHNFTFKFDRFNMLFGERFWR